MYPYNTTPQPQAKARAGKGAAEAEQAEGAVRELEGQRAGDAARGEALGRMIAEVGWGGWCLGGGEGMMVD